MTYVSIVSIVNFVFVANAKIWSFDSEGAVADDESLEQSNENAQTVI